MKDFMPPFLGFSPGTKISSIFLLAAVLFGAFCAFFLRGFFFGQVGGRRLHVPPGPTGGEVRGVAGVGLAEGEGERHQQLAQPRALRRLVIPP